MSRLILYVKDFVRGTFYISWKGNVMTYREAVDLGEKVLSMADIADAKTASTEAIPTSIIESSGSLVVSF